MTAAVASIGWEVWSLTRDHGAFEGDNATPVGGICVAVGSSVNVETGELERAYVVIDTWHGRIQPVVLATNEIDTTTTRPATDRLITDLARRLARDIANYRARNTTIPKLTATEVRLARHMVALHDELIARNGPAHYHLDTPTPYQPSQPRPAGQPNVSALCD